jgi:hypothetical protein
MLLYVLVRILVFRLAYAFFDSLFSVRISFGSSIFFKFLFSITPMNNVCVYLELSQLFMEYATVDPPDDYTWHWLSLSFVINASQSDSLNGELIQ